jgi:hypothetical protein
LVLLYAVLIVDVAWELVGNRHVQQALGLKEYWGKLDFQLWPPVFVKQM